MHVIKPLLVMGNFMRPIKFQISSTPHLKPTPCLSICMALNLKNHQSWSYQNNIVGKWFPFAWQKSIGEL